MSEAATCCDILLVMFDCRLLSRIPSCTGYTAPAAAQTHLLASEMR